MTFYRPFKIENKKNETLNYMNILFDGKQRDFCYQKENDLGQKVFTTVCGHELIESELENLSQEQGYKK